MFRILIAPALTTLLLLQPALPAAAQSASNCAAGQTPQFVFGFATLKAQLGDSMGNPIECEHANPDNGDTLQQTTKGLSFYRKSTNTPTFTNGSEHWGLTSAGFVFWTGSSIDPPGTATGQVAPASPSLPQSPPPTPQPATPAPPAQPPLAPGPPPSVSSVNSLLGAIPAPGGIRPQIDASVDLQSIIPIHVSVSVPESRGKDWAALDASTKEAYLSQLLDALTNAYRGAVDATPSPYSGHTSFYVTLWRSQTSSFPLSSISAKYLCIECDGWNYHWPETTARIQQNGTKEYQRLDDDSWRAHIT